MGDEDDRRAERALQSQKIVIELESRNLVERGEGLVHQEQGRPQDERAGNRNTHAHAAGKFPWIHLRFGGKADKSQCLVDNASRILPR